jgi:hypothetical protein
MNAFMKTLPPEGGTTNEISEDPYELQTGN